MAKFIVCPFLTMKVDNLTVDNLPVNLDHVSHMERCEWHNKPEIKSIKFFFMHETVVQWSYTSEKDRDYVWNKIMYRHSERLTA
jgi:hypothetical protein